MVGFLLFFLLDSEETRAENVHGLNFVFELGFFVLASNDQAGRYVGDADG